MAPPTGKSFLVSLVLAILILLLVACRGAPGATATPLPSLIPTPADPQTLLQESGRRMAELHTFFFKIQHQGGGTPFGGLEVQEVSGYVISPDRMQITFTARSGGFLLESQLITIGDETFISNPFTGEWQPSGEGASPFGFFDPQKGIAAITANATGAIYSGQGRAKGVTAYRIRASLVADDLRAFVEETAGDAPVEAELWIGVEDLLLRKVVLRGRLTPSEVDGITRTIELNYFNRDVTIEPPLT